MTDRFSLWVSIRVAVSPIMSTFHNIMNEVVIMFKCGSALWIKSLENQQDHSLKLKYATFILRIGLLQLLLPSEETYHLQPKTTNQKQREGLGIVNHPCELAAKCANDTKATHHYRKILYLLSLVGMLIILRIRLCCRKETAEQQRARERQGQHMHKNDWQQ